MKNSVNSSEFAILFGKQDSNRLQSDKVLILKSRLPRGSVQTITLREPFPKRTLLSMIKKLTAHLFSRNPCIYSLSPHLQRDIGLCDISSNRRDRTSFEYDQTIDTFVREETARVSE